MKKTPENHVEFELVAKYLSGEATVSEVAEIEAWLAASDANRAEMESLRLIFAESKKTQNFDSSAAWQKVNARTSPAVRPSWLHRYRMPLAAASLALIALSVLLINPNSEPASLSMHTSDTPIEIILDDGTIVLLNKNSSLEYPEHFAQTQREVTLKGEAFFKVKRNEKSPFSIQVGGAEVKVLGTSFNVKSDAEEVEVVVESGKVSLSEAESKDASSLAKVILEVGETGVFDRAEKTVEEEQSETKNEMFWRTETLTYKGAPLSEVLAELEVIFDVDIELERPELGECPLDATFNTKSLESLLTGITESFNLNFKKNENRYLISGEGCQ